MYHDYENKIYYGFDVSGNWHYVNEINVMRKIVSTDYLANPSEVEQELITEAKKIGYEIGINCIFGTGKYKRQISNDIFAYRAKDNSLLMGVDGIFQDGVWAEIIEETPIKEEQVIDWGKKKLFINEDKTMIVLSDGHYTDNNFGCSIIVPINIEGTNSILFDKKHWKPFKGTLTINQ